MVKSFKEYPRIRVSTVTSWNMKAIKHRIMGRDRK